MNNFVSISAVSDSEQLRGIRNICQNEDIEFPVAIGYQVSNKSINQGTQNPRQLKFVDLGGLSEETLSYGIIPAIHYYTKDNSTILSDLEKIAQIGVNPTSALLQLNTLPISPNILREVKKMGFKILFKVAVSDKKAEQEGYAVWKGKDVQDVESGEISPLIKQVQDRKEIIDYAMFDPSHGTNLDLILDENSLAIRFGKEITDREDMNHLGMVYAGGIKPTNVARITKSLISFFPRDRISIDIESGIRTNDQFDLNLVRGYLVGYKSVF